LTAILALIAGQALGQENPVLDKLVSKKIKEELSKMHSPDTGYRDGPHWLHFDNPGQNLSVSVQIRQAGDRGQLMGWAKAKVAFNYQVSIEKRILGRRVVIARHDFGGYADAKLALEASARLGKKLADSRVSIKEIRVENLRMRSDAAKPFEGLIQGWVNGALQGRKPEFERKLADALNSVKP
jgi:hypothetical protein